MGKPHYPSYSWGVGSSSLISSPELGDTTDVGFSSVFAFFGFFGSACERNRFAPHLRQCTFLESISVQSLPPQNAQGVFICFLLEGCYCYYSGCRTASPSLCLTLLCP